MTATAAPEPPRMTSRPNFNSPAARRVVTISESDQSFRVLGLLSYLWYAKAARMFRARHLHRVAGARSVNASATWFRARRLPHLLPFILRASTCTLGNADGIPMIGIWKPFQFGRKEPRQNGSGRAPSNSEVARPLLGRYC